MSVRQIVLDTETTGLEPKQGHRIIEIGCLELVNRRLTGRQFHVYLNPEREVEEAAFKVHGISNEFLKDKPLFADIANDFLVFVEGAELIIHNAPFDTGFLQAEFDRLDCTHQLKHYCQILDTLVLAKQKHPGQRNNLDALCKRYNVNNSNREFHGALLDAELLAFVYLEMTGGQLDMFGHESATEEEILISPELLTQTHESQTSILYASSNEIAAHDVFMAWIDQQKK